MAKLIGISCGIGRSFEEAAHAVVKSKKHKGKEYKIKPNLIISAVLMLLFIFGIIYQFL